MTLGAPRAFLAAAAAAAAVVAVVVVGCVPPSGQAGDRPEGFRLITGTVAVPEEDVLGRQTTGLQVAGIAIGTADDPDEIDVFPSDVFDGSRIETSRFVTPVDGERSFVLVLQVPSPSTNGPGALVAVLRFGTGNGDSTLLPPGEGDAELGTLTVDVGGSPMQNALLAGDANNPLAQLDTDADGTVDLNDPDDDEDGTPDAADADVGGDDVPDADQVLPALPDEEPADGIPDLLAG